MTQFESSIPRNSCWCAEHKTVSTPILCPDYSCKECGNIYTDIIFQRQHKKLVMCEALHWASASSPNLRLRRPLNHYCGLGAPSTTTGDLPRPLLCIPHICHLFYTTAIWGLEILHLKVHNFAKQRRLPSENSNHEFSENYDMNVALWIK